MVNIFPVSNFVINNNLLTLKLNYRMKGLWPTRRNRMQMDLQELMWDP